MHLLQACVIEPFRFEPLGYIPPIYGRNSLSNLPTPELIQVPARVLSRQAADQHTTVLGGMLSCVMVPPNGSVSWHRRHWRPALSFVPSGPASLSLFFCCHRVEI